MDMIYITYIRTYIITFNYIYLYNVYIYNHIKLDTDMYKYECMYLSLFWFTGIWAPCVFFSIFSVIYSYIYTYTQIYIYIYIYTYIYNYCRINRLNTHICYTATNRFMLLKQSSGNK